MIYRKYLASALTVIIVVAVAWARPADPEPMSGKTALEFFNDKGIRAGWNLGNTMDAVISGSGS